MRRLFPVDTSLVAVFVVLIVTAGQAITAYGAELNRIRVTAQSAAADYIGIIFIAQEKGFFANEGLEVQLTYTKEPIKAEVLIGSSAGQRLAGNDHLDGFGHLRLQSLAAEIKNGDWNRPI